MGLDGWISLRLSLFAFGMLMLLWLVLGRREKASLFAFYLVVTGAGLVHTLLMSSSIARDDLRLLPEEKTFPTTQWRGTIIEEPTAQLSSRITRRAMDRTSFVLEMEAWRPTGGRLFGAAVDAPWQPAQGEVRCTVIGPAKELQCGDRIEFASALVPVEAPLCPGELDYNAWEAAQGIYYHASIASSNWQRIETGGGNWWQKLSFRARDWAYGQLQLGLEDDPRMADFLAGMLIGYRQQIPVDIEQDFRRTGTLHVFAVSGQNIAEMIVVAMILLQLCGFVRWRWAWTLAPLILLYCLLTGSPSSAIRATVMALAVLAAWRMGRPLNALGCWSLAFIAMLIWNPPMLFDPGAQLSFGVVLALILVAPPLLRLIDWIFEADPFLPRDLLTSAQKFEEKGWYFFCALLATSVAATIISEPITAIDFHQITPISVLANLLVVPMAGLITIVGTISVAVSIFSPQLAALFNNSNWLLAKILISVVGWLAHQPGASLNVPDLRTLASPEPSFVVAPLQDSACLLVRTSGSTWLMNTGREIPARTSTTHLLQFYGINRLDGLILAQLSGPDNGGASLIVRDFHPRRLVLPVLTTKSPLEKTMPETIALAGGLAESWQQGQSFDLGGGGSVEVLHPDGDSRESHAEDRALVLLFHAGGGTLLWAGKIGPEVQKDLLAANPHLAADVLVMGAEPPPSSDWLRSLGVRDWIQIPPRDRQGNATDAPKLPDACRAWALNETGAVDVHFQPATGANAAQMVLRPWVAPPESAAQQ